MAFRGVRISWLIRATKVLLARLAASAFLLGVPEDLLGLLAGGDVQHRPHHPEGLPLPVPLEDLAPVQHPEGVPRGGAAAELALVEGGLALQVVLPGLAHPVPVLREDPQEPGGGGVALQGAEKFLVAGVGGSGSRGHVQVPQGQVRALHRQAQPLLPLFRRLDLPLRARFRTWNSSTAGRERRRKNSPVPRASRALRRVRAWMNRMSRSAQAR
jgi:hypothetical protein